MLVIYRNAHSFPTGRCELVCGMGHETPLGVTWLLTVILGLVRFL